MIQTSEQLMGRILENPVLSEGPGIRVFFDGACEPCNPGGVATCGWVIYGVDDLVLTEGSLVVGDGPNTTNNVAEYNALGFSLRWLTDHLDKIVDAGQVNIFGDSRLVVEQVGGNWKCNKDHLRALRDRCRELMESLRKTHVVTLRWVPREENEAADALSRRAYESHTGKKFPMRQR